MYGAVSKKIHVGAKRSLKLNSEYNIYPETPDGGSKEENIKESTIA